MFINLKELAQMSNNLKLLYVEDDENARNTTYKLLKNFFSVVITAVDGVDALEKFREEKFDLIISDINMPRLNGLEMLQEVREQNKEIPVLMLSAYSDSEYFLEAINLDVDGYILKPIVQEQFFKVLYKIVERMNIYEKNINYQENLEAEVKNRNAEIAYKLHFDPLTNLMSRYSFFRDVSKLFAPVVLLIDINKFKIINEVYGNDLGSKVLAKFAGYLSNTVDDSSCKLYRLSADEFAIVDTALDIDTEKYELLIAKLLDKLNNLKVKVKEYTITVDITIGLSSVEENSYESAKIALEYAKEHKKSYIMYSSAIDHRKESTLTLKCRDDIALAIDDKRVVAVYQPIVDKNKNIIKYETLMRLRKEDTLELVSPYEFLEVAIKTRLYEHLSSTVIFKALNKINETGLTLTINLTYSDIKNNQFVEEVEAFLKEHKKVGKLVVFEITESESIENYSDVKSFIKMFRAYGVRIAIDDFGSGFSNFEYILEIEPDYIKIDGSLIKDIDTDSRAHTLVEAIVQFSHKLGIKIIAEYVHKEIIFEMLKVLDVDEYQGFYFYEPLESIE